MPNKYPKRIIRKLLSVNKTKSIIICSAISLLFLIIGVGGGFMLASSRNEQNNEVQSLPKTKSVDSIGEVCVLPETLVEIEYVFTECEHAYMCDETTALFDASEIVGLTKNDIEKKFKNAVVTDMDSDHIMIDVTVNEYCPNHYILTLVDETTLCIFHTNTFSLASEVYSEIDFDINKATDEIVFRLQSGIVFPNLTELDSFVEGLET